MDAPSLLTSWRLEPLQLVPTLLVAALYARRVRTLRRRGTPVERWRPWLFGLGLGLALLALVSPIDAFGEQEFLSFHMVQHVILGDLAPLAMVAGLNGPILRPLLALRPINVLRVLAHPLVALPLWTIDLYVWHLPFLYQAALHDQGLAGAVMMLEGSVVTIAALAWLFLRLASEGELRQQLLERGLDPRAVQRAVRYGRAQEFSRPR